MKEMMGRIMVYFVLKLLTAEVRENRSMCLNRTGAPLVMQVRFAGKVR